MTRIIFAAGGSIGHIAPCVAVWRAVQKIDAYATAHFVCSDRLEDQTFLQKEGVAFTALGNRSVSLITLPWMFLRAWKILSTAKPDVIFTKGGGVTIPIALAGWMRGIPVVTHESDAVPGRATRFISRFATRVIDGFATGNPLRPRINRGSREKGLAITGFNGTRPILLVTGGSQGAQTFNDAIAKHSDELLRSVDIIHITGEGKRGIEEAKIGYWKSPFVHDDLAHLFAATDIALSRAGAGSIGELAANGIPSILVPLEGLAQNHQVKNAEAAARSGGCIELAQSSLDAKLAETVRNLAADAGLRAEMGEKMSTLHKPDADVAVAKILLAVCAEHCRVP